MRIVPYHLLDNKGNLLYNQINCKIIELRLSEKSSEESRYYLNKWIEDKYYQYIEN